MASISYVPCSTSERMVIQRLRSLALRNGRCSRSSFANPRFVRGSRASICSSVSPCSASLRPLALKRFADAGRFELHLVDRVDGQQPARHVADRDGDQHEIDAPADVSEVQRAERHRCSRPPRLGGPTGVDHGVSLDLTEGVTRCAGSAACARRSSTCRCRGPGRRRSFRPTGRST